MVIMGKNNVLKPASLLSLQQLDCIRMMSFVPGFPLKDLCLLSLVIRADLSPVLKTIWYSLFTFTPHSPAYPRFFTVWTCSSYFHLNCIFIPVSPRLPSKADMSSPSQTINSKFPPSLFPPFSLTFFTPKSSSPCLFKFS